MSPVRKYLNEHWQAVGVLLAVFGLGFSGAWKPLRDEVHAQGRVLVDVVEDIAEVRRDIAEVRLKVSRIECILTAQVLERDPIRECGL